VAESSRNTVAVAIAGIAATAAVGIAGSATAWFSARADRSSQRVLARDDRVFSRRAAVYLDAIGLVESQQDAIFSYNISKIGERIPYQEPSKRLTARLVAFGSADAVSAFNRTENELIYSVVASVSGYGSYGNGKEFLVRTEPKRDDSRDLVLAERGFRKQVARFEQIVHRDLAGE
jgi:hypothetical protein